MEEEKRQELERSKKSRRRRRILISLLIAQLVVVALSLGGHFAFTLVPETAARMEIPYRILFFLGMTAGLVLTVAIIFLVLLFTGVFAMLFGRRKKGWPARAVKRAAFAVFMIAVSAAVVCGTAFVLIPSDQWSDVVPAAEKVVDDVKGKLFR